MELTDRLFGKKRKRQENLLRDFGVEGNIKKNEFVGPDYKQADVVEIDNDKFLEILESQKKKRFKSHIRNQDDTHVYREFFLDVGEGLRLKTGVDTLEHVADQKTLLSDLFGKGFKQGNTKDGWTEHEI